MRRKIPQAGEVYEFAYPFSRDTHTEQDEEGFYQVPTWKPGPRKVEIRGHGDIDLENVADAMGRQQITIVGTFRPGKFPLRVFYTRKWIDPDGKVFGKSACRITTIHGFRSLVNGFRHEFKMAQTAIAKVPVC